MTIKRKPHHDLGAIQAKFADVDSLDITGTALRGAQAIGYSLEDVVDVVQALLPQDFVKSETAHNPPNHRVWHDSLSALRKSDARRALQIFVIAS